MPVLAPIAGAAAGFIFNKLAGDGGASKNNQAATDATKQQSAIAQDQWNSYKSTYQPLEKSMVGEAQNYDSQENQDRAAGLSSSTISEQYGKARDRLGRTPGLDPSSGAYASSMVGLDNSQAASDAVGQNAARNRVKDMAWARRTDALSLGKGLPAQASAGLATAGYQSAGLASAQYGRSANEAAGFGKLVSNGLDAYSKYKASSATEPPTSSATEPPAGAGSGDYTELG
jgi:hypothetical protein